MPLYSRCPQCGKAYAAGDELAGQEVRCRKCGTTFTLPLQDNSAEGYPPPMTPGAASQDANVDEMAETSNGNLPATPQIEHFESNMTGGVGSAKSRLERTGPVDEYEVGQDSASLGVTENPLLDFPMAAELDRLLPRALILIMLLLTAWSAWSSQQVPEEQPLRNPSWAGAITAGWLMIVFAAIWLPIGLATARRGMTSVKLRIPYRRVQRVGAIISLPFALGAIFWLLNGDIAGMIAGLVLGSIPAAGAAFFLLRPRPQQLMSVLSPILVGVLISTILSAGLTAGVSALLGQSLRASRTISSFAYSPLGAPLAGLPWPSEPAKPEAPRPAAPPKPAPSSIATIKKPGTPATLPVTSPLVRRANPLATTEGFDRAIFPQPMGEFLALMRQNKNDQVIDVLSLVTGRSNSSVYPVETNNTAAISGDGKLLARLSSFPRLSVQIWSLDEKRIVRSHEIARANEIRIVGFTPAQQVVVQSSRQKKPGPEGAILLDGLRVEVLDVGSSARFTAVDVNAGVAARCAYADDYSRVACILADPPPVKLTIHSLLPADALMQVERTVSFDLQRVDPALAVRPSAMVFSPDGSQIALAFERDRQLGLLIWKTTGSDAAIEHVYPRGLDLPAAEAVAPRRPMVWLANPAVCIYGGTAVLDPVTGQYLGSLSLENVREMSAAGSDRVVAEVGAPGDPPTLLVVDLAEIKR